MDGLILDVAAPERIAPFVPPVCLSPVTAQVLAIALILLLGIVLQETFCDTKGPRR
ncbi:hypothetical protein MKK67_07130 [Methylobacterium sp. J-072]|uniref:hypothetical protein n=1 Tax=Methylobacterium sp. J-072 TaxID=2836651 RepID=UPI001FB91D4F|nr:hypothetical protein [Methylobacterium sp. J-072]MCJ2092267.1 hypothetical protein [Methylobacterium sp. J-072]